MKTRRILALVAVVTLAGTACGSRVSDQQADAEALQDAERMGLSSGVASGSDGGTVAAGPSRSANRGGSGDSASTRTGGGSATGATGSGQGDTSGPGESFGAEGQGESAGAAAPEGGNGGATDVGVTENQITLGWVGTVQGPVPGLFKGALVGTQAFAAYVNSQGGLFGRQLKVEAGDDRLDSGQNRAAHLKLRDSVFAFVGSFSVNDDGGASVLEECECPDVGGSLSRQRFNLPNHFSPQPQPPGWRSGPPKYYAQQYDPEVIQNWALFVSQIESARDIARGARAIYEQEGFNVVYTREVATGESNFQPDVIEMRRREVRSLSWQGTAEDMGRLAGTMRQQGFSVDLPNWGNDAYNDVFLKTAGEDAAEGAVIDQVYALFQGEDAERIPEVALFNQWMQRVDPGQQVDLFAMYGWISARLFVEAATTVGPNLTRPALIEELSKISEWDANGMVGPVNVGQKKASDCFFIFQIRGGEYVRTFPKDDRNFACDVGPYVHTES